MNNALVFVEGLTILMVVKVMVVLLLLIYMIFAGLMMRQIISMTRAVTMRDDFIIKIMGIVHFVFAILVFLMAVFVL